MFGVHEPSLGLVPVVELDRLVFTGGRALSGYGLIGPSSVGTFVVPDNVQYVLLSGCGGGGTADGTASAGGGGGSGMWRVKIPITSGTPDRMGTIVQYIAGGSGASSRLIVISPHSGPGVDLAALNAQDWHFILGGGTVGANGTMWAYRAGNLFLNSSGAETSKPLLGGWISPGGGGGTHRLHSARWPNFSVGVVGVSPFGGPIAAANQTYPGGGAAVATGYGSGGAGGDGVAYGVGNTGLPGFAMIEWPKRRL